MVYWNRFSNIKYVKISIYDIINSIFFEFLEHWFLEVSKRL